MTFYHILYLIVLHLLYPTRAFIIQPEPLLNRIEFLLQLIKNNYQSVINSCFTAGVQKDPVFFKKAQSGWLGRLLRVDLIKPASVSVVHPSVHMVRTSICTSIRPSICKKFLQFV